MEMHTVLLGVAVLASALAVYFARSATRSRLRNRLELSDDQIYQEFYAESGLSRPLVSAVWREAAQVFGVPAGKLRPSDRFGKELGGSWLTSEELDTFGEVARRRAQSIPMEINLKELRTLGDYVERVARARGVQ